MLVLALTIGFVVGGFFNGTSLQLPHSSLLSSPDHSLTHLGVHPINMDLPSVLKEPACLSTLLGSGAVEMETGPCV